MKLLTDLKNLDDAMEYLCSMFGVPHDSIKKDEEILKKFYPPKIPVKTMGGNMECETIVKTDQITIARAYATGETVCKAHSHPQYQLICCIQGEVFLAVSGKLEHLNTGEHILIQPNFLHATYFPHGGIIMIATFPPDTINQEPDNEI